MALWGKTDNAGSSVGWAAAQVNKTANSANRTDLFGNTTQGAFQNNGVAMKKAVGQFGVDATEMGVSNGSIVSYTITFAGSGYTANAAVTVSGNATSNATATGGRISAVNVNTAGSGYTTIPSVSIAAPSAIVFNGNTAVASNTITLTSANSKFLVGDKVTYAGNTTSTPGGLTDTGTYFVSFANTTVIALSATKGGANIALTKASGDNTTAGGATLTGERATAVAALSGARPAAHAGWVLRTVGQGGRAGRVQEETLVAMGSITGDAEDTIMKDS